MTQPRFPSMSQIDEIRAREDVAEAHLERAYLELLRMPHGGVRARNQYLLAGLRDAIAFHNGEFPSDVQDRFEAKAATITPGRGVDEEMVERAARAIMPDAWATYDAPLGKSYRLVLWEEEQARARKYARAAITAASLPQDDGWRDIESAPKDGTRILLYCPDALGEAVETGSFVIPKPDRDYAPHPTVADAFIHVEVKYPGSWETSSESFVEPTKWQPLPAAPHKNETGA